MTSEELIDQLAERLTPVPRHSLIQRLGLGVGLGLAAALPGVLWLGLRADLLLALGGLGFWIKAGYTVSLGAIAIRLTAEQARPYAPRLRAQWWLALPVLVLAAIALTELAQTPAAQWRGLWLGESWKACSTLILLLAVPVYAGLLWAFRRAAPARLRDAGAAAGFTAGAWAATIYGLHCPEASALFVLTWYTLGIAAAAALGAALGARLLRW